MDRAIGWGIDFYPIYRRGSIKMCHVRKHGTWHDFMTCLKSARAKTKIAELKQKLHQCAIYVKEHFPGTLLGT